MLLEFFSKFFLISTSALWQTKVSEIWTSYLVLKFIKSLNCWTLMKIFFSDRHSWSFFTIMCKWVVFFSLFRVLWDLTYGQFFQLQTQQKKNKTEETKVNSFVIFLRPNITTITYVLISEISESTRELIIFSIKFKTKKNSNNNFNNLIWPIWTTKGLI